MWTQGAELRGQIRGGNPSLGLRWVNPRAPGRKSYFRTPSANWRGALHCVRLVALGPMKSIDLEGAAADQCLLGE